MKYLKQFALIMLITGFGELLKAFLPFPIPTSIYGLILMFLLLVFGIIKIDDIKETGGFLVTIMPVMFIPAAVGVMNSVAEVKSMMLPLLITVFPITLLVMVVTGKVTEYLIKRKEGK